mmetsp:Transcript_36696/g.116794  ORF Transcript_36696/g.116794 Transcript_36696/m.116794 type:complete len:681 (+) Transcript_36696:3332-5374(+)|eukprot:scaffold4536_cov113-Isochrysis_galbana.AAC.9
MLKRAQHVRLRQLDEPQLVGLLQILHPPVGLPLRVDHQRPSPRAGDEDGVLDRKGVKRETKYAPLAYGHRITQHVADGRVVGAVDAKALHLGNPRPVELGAVRCGEWTLECNRTRAHNHIADEVALALLERLAQPLPANLLGAKSADELSRTLELDLRVLLLLLELARLGLRVVELALEAGDARLHIGEHDLLFLQHRLGLQQLRLGGGELLLLGLDCLGHAVIRVHGAHPQAQRPGGLGHLADGVGLEAVILDVLLDGLDLLGIDVVLVKVLQRLQKAHVGHELLRFIPRRLLAEEDADGLEHDLHQLGRLMVRLHLLDIRLVERLERIDGGVEGGHCFVEVALRVSGDLSGLFRDDFDVGLLRLDARLDLLGAGLVLRNLFEEHLSVLRGALQDGLQLDKLLLHLVDDDVGLDKLVDAARIVRDLARHQLTLLGEHRRIEVEELQIRCGRGIRLAAELGKKLVARVRDGGLHVDDCFSDGILDHFVAKVDLLEVALGHREQRVPRPLIEPVDGAAVDERGEHAAAHAEGVADGRHGEDDVQVLADELHKVRVDSVAALRLARRLGEWAHLVEDLRHVFFRHHVWHLTSVEQIVDVLHERLLHNLSVREEEHRRLVFATGLEHEALQVIVEGCRVIGARDLDGEARVVPHGAGKPHERRAARSPHADEQRAAARLRDDA